MPKRSILCLTILLVLSMIGPLCPASAANPSEPTTSTEKDVLLQVIVYGLSVFEFDRDCEYDDDCDCYHCELQQVTAHFPATGNDNNQERHNVQVLAGTPRSVHSNDSDLELKPVSRNHNGSSLRIEFPGELDETIIHQGFTIPFPECSHSARDVRWLLDVNEIGGKVTFDPQSTSGRLIVEAGTLETCALVLDEDLKQACSMEIDPVDIKTDINRSFEGRTMSEVMVFREVLSLDSGCHDGGFYQVPRDSDSCSTGVTMKGVFPNQDVCFQCMSLPNDIGVEWNGETYHDVIDVVVRHTPMNRDNGRKVRTQHAHFTKSLFPKVQYEHWELVGKTTSDDDSSSASRSMEYYDCKDVQPTCWTHLQRYDTSQLEKPDGIESSLNTSACPLHGYP